MAEFTMPNSVRQGNHAPTDPPTDPPAARPTPANDPDPVVLCLDLGTQTGWALADGPEIHSGTASFRSSSPLGRFEGGGMRYVHFRHWLNQLAISTSLATAQGGTAGFSLVFFEEVRSHAGTDAAHFQQIPSRRRRDICANQKLMAVSSLP